MLVVEAVEEGPRRRSDASHQLHDLKAYEFGSRSRREASVDHWPTIVLRGPCTDRRAVSNGHFALDLVIQTASGVLTGRFHPREAVTLLATQAPQARAEAPLV